LQKASLDVKEKDAHFGETIVVGFLHLVLSAFALLALLFLVPRYEQFLSRFVFSIQLPKAFELVIASSRLARQYVLIIIPVWLAALWIDALLYATLVRKRDLFLASLWANGVTLFLAGIVSFALWALTLPLGR